MKEDEREAKKKKHPKPLWGDDIAKAVPELVDIIKESIEIYKKAKQGERLAKMMRELFEQKKNINKIVAFSYLDRILSTADPELSGQKLVWHTHLAPLFVIREVWQEMNPNRDIPVFLQATQYLELDHQAAQNFDIQLVNGDIGHQVGWTKLDEDLFVVSIQQDVTTPWIEYPDAQMLFEITRPAAFLTHQPLTMTDEYCPMSYQREIFSLTLCAGKYNEVTIPGLGL